MVTSEDSSGGDGGGGGGLRREGLEDGQEIGTAYVGQ